MPIEMESVGRGGRVGWAPCVATGFALPTLLLEVKAAMPSARSVLISSIEQLVGPPTTRLYSRRHPARLDIRVDKSAISVETLVRDILEDLRHNPDASTQFQSRLSATGYSPGPDYDQRHFRAEPARFYEVGTDFPRLSRAELPTGVLQAQYEISLESCAPFEVLLESA